MQDYDVLIAGGGPAGSSLAWALRGSGFRILVIDKADFPRDKVCAGWITPSIVEALQLDLTDYANGRVLQPITGFRAGIAGGTALAVRYGGERVSFGIRRCEFDHYLLQRCGAGVETGYPLESIERRSGHWIINGAIRSRLLIGAGGHFCPVARYLGADPGLSELAVAAKEIEFRMTDEQCARCVIEEETPELYFCDDLKGYGWIFRKGDYLNIGLGREDPHGLSQHINRFCTTLVSAGRISSDMIGKFRGHAYLLYDHADRHIVDDGVMLIGDAGGFASTRSGEGIRPAVESALLAARVIKSAPDFSSAGLQTYALMVRDRFGRRKPVSFTERLPVSLKRSLTNSLLSSRLFLRHVVLDRWFLQRNRQALGY